MPKGKEEFWEITEEGLWYLGRDFSKSGVLIKSKGIKAVFNKLWTLHGTQHYFLKKKKNQRHTLLKLPFFTEKSKWLITAFSIANHNRKHFYCILSICNGANGNPLFVKMKDSILNKLKLCWCHCDISIPHLKLMLCHCFLQKVENEK